MLTRLIPKEFATRLFRSLTDPHQPAYGQFANVGEGGRPEVRTVHFRYLKKTDQLAVATNTKSSKWRQLARRKNSAGCLFDPHRLIQFRWNGSTQRLLNGPIVEQMWRQVRPDVRLAYWLDYKKIPYRAGRRFTIDLARPCPTFGILLCKPTRWDIMEINPKNYCLDRRTLHHLSGGRWHSRTASVLHRGSSAPPQHVGSGETAN